MKSEKEQHKTKKILNLKLLFLVFGFAFLVFATNVANAATLYFSPSSGNFSVGDILTASILVNTQGKAINNADAVINFPTGLLDVISVNKSGSIFSLWVEEPVFSNSAGSISFNGGLPTPGFNGGSGRILNVTFRVRNAGTASLLFSSATVRANDGYGTDILQTKEQAQFSLISEEKPIAPTPVVGTPQAPIISSPTHSNSDKWYGKSTATFTWPVSSGIDATRLLVGNIPNANPIVLYTPAISQKTIDDIEDGISYFHAQLRNNAGWGGVTHFKFQIDTKKPDSFTIQLATKDAATNPRVKFIFDANDKTSGIDHYEIEIDDNESITWRDDGSGIYETEPLGSGTHVLSAKAVDKAGNFLAHSIEFEVETLQAPIITEYPRELAKGETLVVRGKTLVNAEINAWLQMDDRVPVNFLVQSDGAGNFTIVDEAGLDTGVYKMWAEVTDRNGAKSDPSERVTITVRQPSFWKLDAGNISPIIPLSTLILLLVYLASNVLRKSMNMRKNVRKEINEAEHALHKVFDLLKEDIPEQFKLFDKTSGKHEFAEEKEQIIQQLKTDLEDAEKFIRKTIKNIDKEIK